MRSEPRSARTPVWPLSLSLAATNKIDVSFSSSGYLDVSVHRVPLHTLWIGVWMIRVLRTGFPHSDICGSKIICISPQLFAAYHVFLRLLVPRHPPCALCSFTSNYAILLDLSSLLQLQLFYSAVLFPSSIAFLFCHSIFKVLRSSSVPSDLLLIPPKPSASSELVAFLCSLQFYAGGLKWTRTTDLTLIRRAL